MRLYFTIFTVLANLITWSQNQDLRYSKNLVPNGSFENYRKKSNNIRRAIPWMDIQTIDYYQKVLDNDTTAEPGAYQGECYAGFRFRKKYKEFLYVKLAEPLHRGSIYEFRIQMRLAYWSNAQLRSFGALFTKARYKGQQDVVRGSLVDTVCIKGGLQNSWKWFEVKGYYKADGGEKFLTLGNFSPEVKKDLLRTRMLGFRAREAYYFVDNVSLMRAPQFEEKVKVVIVGPSTRSEEEDSVLSVKPDLQIGEKVSLNNIFFDKGHYYILPESYAELNKLARYLILHPHIEIRINGHSDNSGLAWKNQHMSELRAREVFEYLIRKGVQNKMYFKGFGSSQPVADNSTEIGRARNRRVEFEIVKK
ncbi:MAG TPA: OmpA family protein [Bacteroidia bacterium]|nr:OmpA family protein [Bacteroidia bacterium]